jgi:hypothetical protein
MTRSTADVVMRSAAVQLLLNVMELPPVDTTSSFCMVAVHRRSLGAGIGTHLERKVGCERCWHGSDLVHVVNGALACVRRIAWPWQRVGMHAGVRDEASIGTP